MSDFTEREAFEKSQDSASGAMRADAAQVPSDLEERLAAARLKRQKILAAKGKTDVRPKVRRLAFLEPDQGLETAPDPASAPKFQHTPKTPEALAKADALAAKAARFALLEPQETLASAPPKPQRSAKLSPSRVAAVGFACFFGLGFGMVLSLGAVVGLGWVSLSDVASRLTAADVISDRAPLVYDQSYHALSTPPAAAVVIPSQEFTEISSVTVSQKLQSLAEIPHPDYPPNGILSPGPRVAALDRAAPLNTRLDSKPAVILTAFETPTRANLAPLQSLEQQSNVDHLPALFELNPIKVLSVFSEMPTPSSGAVLTAAVPVQDDIPATGSVPALVNLEMDQRAPAEPRPTPKPVYSAAIENWAPTGGVDGFSNPRFAALNPAPDTAPTTTALSEPIAANALPYIEGPLSRNPNLAMMLAEQGEEVGKVALVTYAPRSVSETELSQNLDLLAATGFRIEASNRVKFKVSKSHVRFYKRSDETMARAIARKIGGEARDFTRGRTSAPSGHIEIWYAGTRSAATKTNKTSTYAQRQAFLKARLRDRLVNSLRRGDHLGSSGP